MAVKAYAVKYLVGRQKNEVIIAANRLEDAWKQGAKRGRVISVNKVSSGGGRFHKMAFADRQIFFQRLASMLASKVGASESLEIIYQSFSGTVREAARILRDQLYTGATLYEAMEVAGSRYFPDTVVAIIRTGAKGGDIAYAIREAARFERELVLVKKESSKGVFSALAGFVAGVVTILASTLYVAPQIMNSSLVKASGDGVNIGWVMTMANITTYIAGGIALLVGGVLMYGVLLRPLAPAVIDRGILKIPFYRDMALAKKNYMVFFGLSVLLKAGLRLEEAFRMTIDSSPKGELRNDLMRAHEAITKGSSQPWPYRMTMLHPTDKAALATAQDRTQIANTIGDLAVQYQAIYKARIELFVPLMQMFSAIFLSIAGFVLFGVSVMPLMQSTSSIVKML